MKNAFYSMLKTLFVLKIFSFFMLTFWFEKRLDKKATINIKIMTSHTQCTYYPKTEEVKATRQSNLIS